MASSIVTGLRSLMLVTARKHGVDKCQCFAPALMQVRYKTMKKPRFRAPSVPKEKERRAKYSKEKAASAKDPRRVNSPVFLSRVPVDDVWIRTYYPAQKHSLEETIVRHQEAADPAMLDNMEGFVYADMELDMKTAKKNKFMSNVKATVLLPHPFEQDLNQKIAIFCKKEEDLAMAKSLGASFIGGQDLVKQVEDGLVDKDDIDVVLCTPDTLQDLLPIRATLRDKFPNKSKGNLSTNIEEMWTLFTKGVSFASQKEEDTVGKLQVPLGQLNMPVDELAANFKEYVSSLCEGRSKNLGPFITKVLIVAPPSRERFLLKVEDYVPGYNTTQTKAQNEDETDSDDEEESRASRK